MSDPRAPEARHRLKSERVQGEEPQARSGKRPGGEESSLEVCFPQPEQALHFVAAVASLAPLFRVTPQITCAGGRVEVNLPTRPAASAREGEAVLRMRRQIRSFFAALLAPGEAPGEGGGA